MRIAMEHDLDPEGSMTRLATEDYVDAHSGPPGPPPLSSLLELVPDRWFSNSDIASLANDDLVATWPDLSGGSYDATPPSSINKPIKKTVDGVPCALFNGAGGSASYFQYPPLNPLNDFTLMALIRLQASRTNRFVCSEYGTGYIGMSICPNTDSPGGFSASNSGNQYPISSTAAMTLNEWHVITMKRGADPRGGYAQRVYLDGEYCGFGATAGGTGITTDARIGYAGWDTNIGWLDYIAEIGMWKRNLDSDEHRQAEMWMADIGGVTLL